MSGERVDSVILSDLSIAQPESAVADYPKEHCWLSTEYELADGTKGVMLSAEPYLDAPQIEIPLSRAGADGFCVWDCERRPHRAAEWNVLKNLGHRDLLDDFIERTPDYYRANALRRLRGLEIRGLEE